MRIDKDLVAASATPLVLGILAEGESYGYAILKKVNELSAGEMRWTDGMLYPLLHRLERLGYIQASWRVAASGRRRKHYAITQAGLEAVGRAVAGSGRWSPMRWIGCGQRLLLRCGRLGPCWPGRADDGRAQDPRCWPGGADRAVAGLCAAASGDQPG